MEYKCIVNRSSPLFSILIFLLFSCKEEPKKKNNDFQKRPYSELALLMLQLEQNHMAIKQKIQEGDKIKHIPKDYNRLISSKATFESDIDSIFIVCAKEYIKLSKELTEAKDQKKAYNKLVKACINCHLNNCGGPIKRISRLYIE